MNKKPFIWGIIILLSCCFIQFISNISNFYSCYFVEKELVNININHNPTIQDRIREIANGRMKPADIETLINIGWCESWLQSDAINYNTNGTVDIGLFQINSVHGISSECLFDSDCNINEAINIANTSGFSAWTCYNMVK